MRISLSILLSLVCLTGCSQKEKKNTLPVLPQGYDISRIQKIKLSEDLEEISGIFYDTAGPRIIAENDEEGKLFALDPQTGKIIIHTTFKEAGDFEDLIRIGNFWYVMRSNGNIFKVNGAFTDSVKAEVFKLHLPGFNNFETIFYNASVQKAYLICKQCESDSGKRISIYAFDPKTSTYDDKPVMAMIPDRSMLPIEDSVSIIKPAAAAIHPITGEWYIMASVNRLLIVADNTGKWKKVYPLDKEWFKQPEGMCFAPNGDLYVSNEARSGTPNIIHVPWTGK
jgi:hypothetical protein